MPSFLPRFDNTLEFSSDKLRVPCLRSIDASAYVCNMWVWFSRIFARYVNVEMRMRSNRQLRSIDSTLN